MYNKNSKKDWLTAAVTAGLGAGIVTTVAVSQGQNVLVALAITGFAVGVALILDHFL
jgi:energy-converting hydrogenase Eha subunit G